MFEIVYRRGQSAGKRSPIFPDAFETRQDARDALYRVYAAWLHDAAWPQLNIVEVN